MKTTGYLKDFELTTDAPHYNRISFDVATQFGTFSYDSDYQFHKTIEGIIKEIGIDTSKFKSMNDVAKLKFDIEIKAITPERE